MTPARLSVNDVSVRFGGLMALEGVGLEVGDNQLLGFIGPNGAGKTTLMRVIMGIVQPVSGQVMLDGQDISKLNSVQRIHAGVALGQQIVKPLRAMSLLDNVALAFGGSKLLSPLRALSVRSRATEREVARAILSDVGLGAVTDKLAIGPRLLLLDEPLAGLSKPEAGEMADLIAGLPRPGLSVVLIEHNLPQVLRVCPHLYVQANGRGLAFGPTDVVMAMPAVRKAYLGGEG
jgi:branched-chain amino acid transport system ATP-binding protein